MIDTRLAAEHSDLVLAKNPKLTKIMDACPRCRKWMALYTCESFLETCIWEMPPVRKWQLWTCHLGTGGTAISVVSRQCKNQTFGYPGVASAPLLYFHTPRTFGWMKRKAESTVGRWELSVYTDWFLYSQGKLSSAIFTDSFVNIAYSALGYPQKWSFLVFPFRILKTFFRKALPSSWSWPWLCEPVPA